MSPHGLCLVKKKISTSFKQMASIFMLFGRMLIWLTLIKSKLMILLPSFKHTALNVQEQLLSKKSPLSLLFMGFRYVDQVAPLDVYLITGFGNRLITGIYIF
uniref:Uncharacterized protein n=1 Tax=Spongospora subterranea TaxID=70186 RepID=A0A0H5QSJ5_9EUKA|eukprot:CRZ04561.1 hypothetical protein [Spongospora subterranea]